MFSNRIIAKQGNSLLGLSLNLYVMTKIVYVYHFYQSQFTLFRDILVRKPVDLKITEIFYTLAIKEV